MGNLKTINLFRIIHDQKTPVKGTNLELVGNCSNLTGDVSYLIGNCSNIKGNASNLEGDLGKKKRRKLINISSIK